MMEEFFTLFGVIAALLLSLALFFGASSLLLNIIKWNNYRGLRTQIADTHRSIGEEFGEKDYIAACDVQIILKKLYHREWPVIGVIRERREHELDVIMQKIGPGICFQARVVSWLLKCFGSEISKDRTERSYRFLEEALELVQACGCSRKEALQLVDYTFSRPLGEKKQEVGGVMVTLAALCAAQGIDMMQSGEVELKRVWTKIPQIRAKQQAKPMKSPLPGSLAPK
ncbi:MAG TPA: hypothetical protein VFL54_09105 [Gammaproteobacteria bacterium]|nr:hypothetical protein [Gammaproteobacteria bacterium]